MMGSLYHFYDEIESLLFKMLNSAPLVIISYPVRNLSSKKGMIGKISRKLTNEDKEPESFRMKKDIIIEIIHERN
jgi:hypothetical protein